MDMDKVQFVLDFIGYLLLAVAVVGGLMYRAAR